MNVNTFFILDAFALIFRAYYAFIKNPMINSKEVETSAVFGFTNSLLEIIRKEKPSYLAVAFDKGGSAYRRQMYEDYKANRKETPEPIKIAIPYIKRILKAMNINVLELEGYEADDIIGTVVKQAEHQDIKTYIVTSDKDFAQLVSENIFMYKPSRMGNGVEIWGVDQVKEKFQVDDPIQVIDFLGMMGDAVDNIPGLPGVGEKTAKKFIKTYGSMENLLKNVEDLKGKMKEKIINNKDLGLLSKKLATIMLDVPITFKEDEIKFSKPNQKKVESIFEELEFRRLVETFRKTYNIDSGKEIIPIQEKKKEGSQQLDLFANIEVNTSSETVKTIKNTSHIYQYIDSPLALEIFLEKLLKQDEVCFDTETTSLNTMEAELVGIAFSWKSHSGYYVPFGENKEEVLKKIVALKSFFENDRIRKIGHNLKYDIQVLDNYNVRVKGMLFDTMIAHYLIDPDMQHNMDLLSKKYIKYNPIPIETLIGKKGIHQKSMRNVSLSKQTEYAVEDTDITYQLKCIFENILKEKQLENIFTKVEIPLLYVLSDMERQGIMLDKNILKELSKKLKKEIISIREKICQWAGEEFNIDSPKQLGVILFEKMKISDKPKKTKTGQYSTSEETLSYLSSKHGIVRNILEYRQLQKLQNTYVEALPRQVSNKTGRIHTSFGQAIASTGRLSSNNPNLQNIPIRSDKGKSIRKAFVPRSKEYILLSADYSQIELRIIAALSGDEQMIKSFNNKEDIHSSTAAKVFSIPVDEVTSGQRSHAKTVNFGIIYGVSAFGLSNQTDLSRTEAKELIETYYKTYPKLREYTSNQIKKAQKKGYVETILGRRRYLPNIQSNNHMMRSAAERNAVNAPIQGSAADIIKIAMVNIHRRLKGYNSKMILQVHDELVFDVKKEEKEELEKIIKYEMENAYKLRVPLDVEIGLGNNWLEAH